MSTNTISRRTVLKGMLATSALLALPNLSRLLAQKEPNFYVDHQDEILAEVQPFWDLIAVELDKDFKPAVSKRIITDAQARYAKLLPELPYIGGFENYLTENLYLGAVGLTLYQAMTAEKLEIDKAGEILYRAVEGLMATIPAEQMEEARKMYAGTEIQTMFEADARRSQQREYPDDWVYEFIPGKKGSFNFGVDYLECGICKLFNQLDAAEFTPYLCLLDFPQSEVMGTGLQRTTTLAQGDACCDFRYTVGGELKREWTPEFLAEREQKQG